MDNIKWDVFLSGPYLTKDHFVGMLKAREILMAHGLTINDPRENSHTLEIIYKAEGGDVIFKQLLNMNVKAIEDSFCMISCIDDRDTGTAWEMGFAHGVARYYGRYYPRITFSAKGMSSNPLIAQSVHAHAFSLEALEHMIHEMAVPLKERDEIALDVFFSASKTVPAELP